MKKGSRIWTSCQGSVLPEVNFLDLDGFEKALGGSVVVGISLPGHADPKAVIEKHFDIVVRGILDAPIGVMDDPLGGTPIGSMAIWRACRHKAVSILGEMA